MTLAQRGEPEAMVLACIGKIADSHLGSIKQIYYGGDDLFLRQASFPQIMLKTLTQAWQSISEFRHASKFNTVPHHAPVRMIAVLLALPGIKSGCLQVPLRVTANPHIGVSWRYRQPRIAFKLGLIGHRLFIGTNVAKSASPA